MNSSCIRSRSTRLAMGLIFLTSTSLAACSRSPSTDVPAGPADSPATLSAAPSDPPLATAAHLPASEYLETLTEQAFSATPGELDAIIAQVRTAAQRDRGILAPVRAAELDRRLGEITDYRADLNRADLAIASVEAFRLFVSAAPPTGTVPVEVSLLDYAGFRYQADLKAEPVRWDDAAAAAGFAADQWARISVGVTDTTLRTRFSNAVSEMKLALADRNATLAALVGARELDLVDELETYFSRP